MTDALRAAERLAALAGGIPVNVVDLIQRRTGTLPQIGLEYEPDNKLLWITMRPEPKPVLTLPLIESIRKVQLAVSDIWGRQPERPILFMACRAVGAVYSFGGDLDFYLDCLARNDRVGLLAYARAASDVILMSRHGLNGAVITLANMHARAMGGGVDSARGCNLVVAEEGAGFSYPEVNYNHFPIAAVPILSRHAGPIAAEQILLSGKEYDAAEFLGLNVVNAVVERGKGDDWIRAYAKKSQSSHAARVAVFAAFNSQAGDLGADLAGAAEAWVSHIMTLRPLEISKLQRIAAAQERMMGRVLRIREERSAAAGA